MALAKVERELAAKGQGCLGKAADDEPVFILRGQDMLADAVVDAWAFAAEKRGVNPDKVREVRGLAEAMRAWPRRRMPD